MGKKEGYNVMAVYSLRDFAGREMFVGTLEEISNKRNLVGTDPVKPL